MNILLFKSTLVSLAMQKEKFLH